MVHRRRTGRSCWVHIDGGRVVRILVPRFTLNMAPSWALFFPLSLCCGGTFCDEEENYAVALVLSPLPLPTLMTPPGNQIPHLSSLPRITSCAYKNGGGRTLCLFSVGTQAAGPTTYIMVFLFFLHVLPLGVCAFLCVREGEIGKVGGWLFLGIMEPSSSS